jgi:hypothetical protein
MQPPKLSRALPALSVLLLLLIAAWQPAPDRQQVAGTFTMTYSQMNPLPVGDAEGHVLISNHATGANRSTGRDAYMDGADVANTEIADLTQGNGPHQGYVIFSSGGDRTVNKWNGTVTTVLGPDKQPATSFEGTWTKVNGAGRYDQIGGRGTYRGRMTSPQSYVVEWKGEIDLKGGTASR